jgi:hypothetical protein
MANPSEQIQTYMVQAVESIGAPGTTRTCDLLIRSQTLYPTELRVQTAGAAVKAEVEYTVGSTKVSRMAIDDKCELAFNLERLSLIGCGQTRLVTGQREESGFAQYLPVLGVLLRLYLCTMFDFAMLVDPDLTWLEGGTGKGS